MRNLMSGCVLGVCCLQWMPVLPPSSIWWAGLLLGVVCGGTARRLTRQRMHRLVLISLAGFLLGMSWAGLRANWRLADALPAEWQGRDIVVTGQVTGLPERLNEGGLRFVVTVEQASAPVPGLIQLSWYPARGAEQVALPDLVPGERWHWTVRLRRPHGFSNPHGFDYEAWLLGRGIRATGYVRAHPPAQRLTPAAGFGMHAVHHLRDRIRKHFASMLQDAPYAGILTALAMGDQRAIPESQWQILRNTGVAHLVSISGLHVSLVALLLGGGCAWLWRRSVRLLLWCPARIVGVSVGLLAATVYALLAGMALPTVRALVMLAVVALAWLLGRLGRPSHSLALALAVAVIWDPWCVLAAGFWLSFGAVAAILYVMGGRVQVQPAGWSQMWRNGLRVQLAISLLTMPILLMLFQAFPLISPIANALAIPVVSFLVTPLVLLAIVVPWAWPLQLAHGILALLMPWLEAMAAWPGALWQQAALPPWLGVAVAVACAWWVLPRGTPARHAAMFVVLPALLWSPARPQPGEVWLTVLDVGNGTAVHIQTAHQDVLYDLGPRYGSRSDAGERVLVPYLRAIGVRELAGVLISHEDADHSGGLASVLREVKVAQVWSDGMHPGLEEAGIAQVPCTTAAPWVWDGVEFEILPAQPAFAGQRIGNDQSCVLRVSTTGGSVLLPGDLERPGEQALLRQHGGRMQSTVVIAPHHGSGTSSSRPFVEAVAAQHVIFSVGYLNPFRHPHPTVVKRWQDTGAQLWRTDEQGAVLVTLTQAGVEVSSQRAQQRRYWHAQ